MGGDRLVRAAHHALIVFFVVGSMLVLSAQAVVDPRYVEFNASPNHNTLHTDGSAIVASYALAIYPQGSSTAFAIVDLGKPTPNASNVIRVDFLPLLTTLPTPGVNYEARVTALGPGGATASAVSNAFSFAAPCVPGITPTSRTASSSATTGSVTVTNGVGCAWTAVSNAGWITLTGSTGGSGNGTVAYSVAPNTSATQRQGSVTIAGQTFTVTQSGVSCSYSLSPIITSVAAGGGTGSTAVTAPAGCAWTATNNATGWLTVTAGSSGSGNGTVSFSATANSSSQTRQGTLTIGGQTFTVTQLGVACTISLSPVSASMAVGGGTGSTAITAPAGCAWTAVSNASGWLSVNSNTTSGSGNGSVSYSTTANAFTQSRQGTLTIGGQTFTVNQAAAPCAYALTPASGSVGVSGGSVTTSMSAQAGCAWTASSNAPSWLTVSAGGSGSGNGTITINATANTATQTRQGTVTIAGQTYTVNQAATPCTYALTPVSSSVAASGGTVATSMSAEAGCAWTASSNAPSWLTISAGGSGNGNGTITLNATANTATQTRQGTVTIGGQTYAVNQAAAGCTFTLNPTTASIAATGGNGTTSLSSLAGCSWTAVSNAPSWLTVTAGSNGSGPGTISFAASANNSSQARQGTLTIGGQTFTVDQPGAACTYSLSPVSASVASGGGTGSTAITAPAGCTWTAASDAPSWLSITGSAGGSGNGSVAFSAAANAVTQSRQGTLTIGGQTFTVSQAAAPCTYALTPVSNSVGSSGGTVTTSIAAPAGCAWTASSDAPSWLTISGGGSGSGNGTVTLAASTNTATQVRQGAATIGGQTFTVNQAAAGCTFTLNPTSASVAANGANGTTTVSSPAGCAWTATSNAPSWLTVTVGSSGSGGGTVSYSASANTQAQTRQGTITIGGRTFTVTQAASTACQYSVSPTSRSVRPEGGTVSVNLNTGTTCNWTATTTAGWISLNMWGTGSRSIDFTAAPNTTGSSRSGTLTIGGQTVTVTQGSATKPAAPRNMRVVIATSGGS